jgi:hypothetical protein
LCTLPEIGEIAAGIAAVVFRPGNQNLMVSRRKAKDGEWIIIHNRSLDAAAVAFQYREDFKTDFPWGNRERLAGPGFTPESDALGGVAASGDTGYSRYAVFRVRGRD